MKPDYSKTLTLAANALRNGGYDGAKKAALTHYLLNVIHSIPQFQKEATMKIAHLPYELRLRQTFRIARNASDTRNVILIKIAASHNDFSKEFKHGLGEIIPYAYYGQTHELALQLLPRISQLLETENPPKSIAEVTAIVEKMRAKLVAEGCEPRAIKHLESAIAGALMDLCAKLRGISLMDLLKTHLSAQEKNTLRFPLTSYTLGIDTPERMKEKTLEAVDFKILKIKLGQSAQQDQQSILAVRSCTNTLLRVDANCGWDVETSLTMSRWLEDFNVEFIEQPLSPKQVSDHKIVLQQTKIPIILDESILDINDIEKNKDSCSGVNLKFSKSGGFLPCLEMVRKARANNLKVMLGSMIETSVGIGFAYHLSALVDYADLDGNVLTANDPYANQGNLVIRDGRVTEVSRLPGLGITDPHTAAWIEY